MTYKLSTSGPADSPSGSHTRSLAEHWPSLYSLRCGLSSWGFQRWLFPDNRMHSSCPEWCCSTGKSSWGSWRRMQVSWHYTSLHWNPFPRSRSSSAMSPGLSASVSGLRWYEWHGRRGNRLQTDDTFFPRSRTDGRSLMKCRKGKGSRTVPGETPEVTLAVVDWQPSTTTCWVQSPRKASTHFIVGPCIPNSRSLLNSLPWDTLSKPLLKSNMTMSVWCPSLLMVMWYTLGQTLSASPLEYSCGAVGWVMDGWLRES